MSIAAEKHGNPRQYRYICEDCDWWSSWQPTPAMARAEGRMHKEGVGHYKQCVGPKVAEPMRSVEPAVATQESYDTSVHQNSAHRTQRAEAR